MGLKMIDHLVSKGVLPDGVLRKGIQHFIGQRIKEDIGFKDFK